MDGTFEGALARVEELVRTQLLGLKLPGVSSEQLHRDALLIDDLGLDSLKFVDLSVALEEALGVPEFPMQDWVDRQLELEAPLSVGALVDACRELLARGAGDPC